MKSRHVTCLVIILIFFVFSIVTLKKSLTPYVTIAEARTAPKTVQIRGSMAGDKVVVAADGKTLSFMLRDEAGEEALIVYRGSKPEGLDLASSIVAVGRYQNSQFAAEKLLVKCPSKYQGSVKQ